MFLWILDRYGYGKIIYMERIPEPELMDTFEQARAYAEADFDEPNSLFVNLFLEKFNDITITSTILDLGCGPADIPVRFARRFPECEIHAVDGSEAMLFFAKIRIQKEPPEIQKRIKLIHALIPTDSLPLNKYDAVISNSLLHHLKEPDSLWKTIKRYARKGAPVMIMDLIRPETRQQAAMIVERYSKDEPEILKRDFFNSLCAAYTIDEIKEQLQENQLYSIDVSPVSDRHLLISGRL